MAAALSEAEAQRNAAAGLLNAVMMQIVARPDMQSLFGLAETELWERARAFLNDQPQGREST